MALFEQPVHKVGGAHGVSHAHGLSEAVCRAGFLKKVYGILAAQLSVTVAIAAVCMYTTAIREALLYVFHLHSSTFRWGIFIPTIASLLILKLGAKDRYPSNYIWLGIFTVCISVNVGYVCAIAEAFGLGSLVLQAFCTTAAIFLGLTLYTIVSGQDFSYMGGFLSVALWGLLLTGLAGFFCPALIESLVYGFVGALTFCGYILYDTSRLLKKMNYDDYIPATIELYLDIVNLFLYILRILLSSSKGGKKNKK